MNVIDVKREKSAIRVVAGGTGQSLEVAVSIILSDDEALQLAAEIIKEVSTPAK
jgi:hypothetical protein